MRRKTIRISPELLCEFLANPTPPGIHSDFPPGARIVGCTMDETMMIVAIVEHPDFPEVPPGEQAPDLVVRFTRDN